MIADGLYTQKGITVPEFIGRKPECVKYMLKGLKERGVVYEQFVEELND
jgi:mannitol/fructose-specific phosphotransferase system IIA component